MKNHLNRFIQKYRFKLLFAFTLIFLIVPSYFKNWILYDVVTFFSLTFVFTQSLFIITDWKKRHHRWIIVIFILVLFFTWFEVLIKNNPYVNLFRFLLYVVFFIFTIVSLARFIRKAKTVTGDVVVVSVVIYLLMGILGGSAAFLFYHLYPDAFHFTYAEESVDMLEMMYFGYITMATVGYGDITPARPETKTLAYLLAVFGQLYLAIIIAFIVGKFLSHKQGSEG
jgi:hypothetical protein